MNEKRTNKSILVMDAGAIQRALRRIAHEIIERNPDLNQIILAGIPSRGNEIARRIASASMIGTAGLCFLSFIRILGDLAGSL